MKVDSVNQLFYKLQAVKDELDGEYRKLREQEEPLYLLHIYEFCRKNELMLDIRLCDTVLYLDCYSNKFSFRTAFTTLKEAYYELEEEYNRHSLKWKLAESVENKMLKKE